MFVKDVAALYRQLVDESDTTWLTNANIATYLTLGYEEFRRHVTDVDPSIYEISQQITLATPTKLYDLGGSTNPVRLLGSSLTAGARRLLRLHGIVKVDAAGNQEYYLTAARNSKDLGYFSPHMYTTPTYYLQNSVLHFGEPISGNYVLVYFPEQNVDWTKQATSDTTFIDDLSPFHDLIAYLAAKIYAARDGGQALNLDRLTNDRLKQLVDWVQRQRVTDNMDSVYQEY